MPDPSLLHEDVPLIRRIAAGDEQAFRIIFNRYHNRLGAHIYRITQSRELAQEITQDVFLKIWINRESMAGVLNFKSYLFMASRNQALDYLRKTAHERRLTTALESVTEHEEEDAPDDNARYVLIDEAIDHLPPQQRQVYLLSRHERLKYNEIASRLSLSRETVKKYLQLSSESISNYIRKRLITNILLLVSFFI